LSENQNNELMIHHESCPLCKSADLAAWLTCVDHLVSKKTFKLVRCGGCGFVFTQDTPDEQEIAAYYQAEEYISHNPEARGALSSLYRIARTFMTGRKRRYIEKTAQLKSGSILDIGCGTGHFAHAMKEAGWKVTGIEPGDSARNYAISNFGLNVIVPGQISGLPDRSFDCITMWHVMEHFHDPFGYVSEISRLLKPGGLCLTALPNSNSYDARHFRQNWAAYDVPRHLWHFTPDTLSEFAGKTGFSVAATCVLPFDVFYISILSEKESGASLPFLKGSLKGLWFAIRTLFNKSGGSSLYYLLKADPY
jgi:2-polyprenyl-3-methyl-5-hydroxy-6-metoxy-1,4-benzoquinol methylase